MKRKPRFTLIETTCRRCGIPILAGSRSLHGADAAKAELGGICRDCTTPEEAGRMIDAQARAILGGGK